MSDAAFLWLARGLMWAAGGLLVFALTFDPLQRLARRRRQCPRCRYDLSATEGLRCSECGYEAKRERRLYRGRPSCRLALIALFVGALAYALRVTPAIKDRGWIAAVPSSVLVWIAPVGDQHWGAVFRVDWPAEGAVRGDPTHPLLSELTLRGEANELAAWQWHVFLDRFFQEHPDELEWIVHTRDVWPVDTPIAVSLQQPAFLFERDDMLVRARPAGSNSNWCERGGYVHLTRDHLFQAGHFSSDSPRFEIELLLGVRRDGKVIDGTHRDVIDMSEARVIWSGVGRPIQIRGSINDHMTSGEGDSRKMSALLEPGLWRHNSEVRLGMASHVSLGNPGDALGMRAEVIRNGEVVATGDVVYLLRPQGTRGLYLSSHSFFPLAWEIPPPHRLLPGDQWQIRLTSDPRIAMRDLREGARRVPHAIYRC